MIRVIEKKIVTLIALGLFLVPGSASARGKYLVPMFSKTWWKYTAINCAMVQARLSYGEYVYRDRMKKYRGGPAYRPFDWDAWRTGLGTGAEWYPVSDLAGWQRRQKEVGTTYGY